jgi:hypothetical protein
VTTELIKNLSTDAVVVLPAGGLVLDRFIRVILRQFDFATGFYKNPGLVEAILSANRLSSMVRFGKIAD